MFTRNFWIIPVAVMICVYLLWTAEHLKGPKDKLKRIWRNRAQWERENTTLLRSSLNTEEEVTEPEKATPLKSVEASTDIVSESSNKNSKAVDSQTASIPDTIVHKTATTRERVDEQQLPPLNTKPWIAICAATRSKSTWNSLRDTSLQQLLVPSILRTITPVDRSKYDFRLYLAADHDDDFWLKHQNNVKTPDWLSVHVGFYEVPKHKIPFNPMMRAAFDDGAEYMVRINDDSEFLTSDWVSKATAKLASYSPPNVGMVGPDCREGNTHIMTHDMVHRTHLDIFDHYYPEVFSAWWIDDWISKVYGTKRSTKMLDWRVKHHTYKHGKRYAVQHHEKQLLKGQLEKGRKRIAAWLKQSLDTKIVCNFEPETVYDSELNRILIRLLPGLQGILTFWITEGTLISSIRWGGNWDDYDIDIDALLPSSEQLKDLVVYLHDQGVTFKNELTGKAEHSVDTIVNSISKERNLFLTGKFKDSSRKYPWDFTVHFYIKTSEGYRTRGPGRYLKHAYSSTEIFPLRQCKYYESVVPCPNDAITYLAKYDGNEYGDPVTPKWDKTKKLRSVRWTGHDEIITAKQHCIEVEDCKTHSKPGAQFNPKSVRQITEYQSDFITNKKYIRMCDVAFKTRSRNDFKLPLKSNSVVCAKGDRATLSAFFKLKVNVPFTLVTIEMDDAIPQNIDWPNNKYLKRWYSWNSKHPDVIPIPIGLNEDSQLDPMRQATPVTPKIEMALANFKQDRPLRTSLFNKVKDLKFVHVESYSKKWQNTQELTAHYESISKYKWTLCPRGLGQDTHRLWEALYLGSIPVVLKSSISSLYEGLPVIQLNNWDELSLDMLKERSKSLPNDRTNAYFKHWENMIRSPINKIDLPQPSPNRVISYSLYGSNPRYTDGALANAKLIKEIYPDWSMRVYYDNTVPQKNIQQLRANSVQLMDMTGSKMNKMSWRFQAAADTQRFCARDIDSRLSKREAAAVQEWIQSGKKFHVIRDHPSHSKYAMSGGMWCSTTIPNIETLLTGVENQAYLQDMDFLNTVIWPMAQKSLLQHDSFSCDKFGGGKPFPTPRVGHEHVGSVYINGKMRQRDVDILKRKGVVQKCAAIVSSTDRESPVDGVVRARKIDSDYYLYVDTSNTILSAQNQPRPCNPSTNTSLFNDEAYVHELHERSGMLNRMNDEEKNKMNQPAVWKPPYLIPGIDCPFTMTPSYRKVICGAHDIPSNRPCVVYSFGSQGNDDFEVEMRAAVPHCEIHIFDPTTKPEHFAGKWNYHYIGLGGVDAVTLGHTGASSVGMRVKTLPTIMRELGHSFVDILKFDIEGSEYAFVDSMRSRWKDTAIGYIQVEYHVGGVGGWKIAPGRNYYSVIEQINEMEEAGFRMIKGGVFPGSHNRNRWPDLQDIVELSLIHRDWTPKGWVDCKQPYTMFTNSKPPTQDVVALRKTSAAKHGIRGCEFVKSFSNMKTNVKPATLLRNMDKAGGISINVRKSFMQDLFSTLHKHNVHYWLEEGTLIQAVRSELNIPDEPPFQRFDDVDIGIRDVSLEKGGTFYNALEALGALKFEIIRCGNNIISLHRDGDYVDVMIFASTSQCAVRQPDARKTDCSKAISKYVLHTHTRTFLGVQTQFPGRTMLETTEYLEAMFGKNWKAHDIVNWNGKSSGKTRGQSTKWDVTEANLAKRGDRFYLDPKGERAPASCPSPCPYTYQSVMSENKRTIRMDDYPFPSTMPIPEQQKKLKRTLNVFEENNIPYILGVSPLQLLLKGNVDQHIEFLNSLVKKGYVCMHGFNHRTTKGTDTTDTSRWKEGGEFAQYTPSELESLWNKGNEILTRVNRYTTEHFIPPFNAITQDMVDVLMRHGVKYIHSFDVAVKYRLEDAEAHPSTGGSFGGWLEDYKVNDGVTFVVSEWHKTYWHAKNILPNRFSSQITLHWIYDTKKQNVEQIYRELAKKMIA